MMQPPAKRGLGPVGLLLVTLATSIVWGSVWAVITTGAMDLDPWFGAHAALVCPRTCKRCTGPYAFLGYTSVGRTGGGGGGTIMYCSHPDAKLHDQWATMMSNVGHNRRYEVEHGLWMIWLSSVLTWILPALAAVLLVASRWRKRTA
jgi:hypothetical protein